MNIKEPKVFKYLALGFFFVIPIFVFFGFKANTASAATIYTPASVLYLERNDGNSPDCSGAPLSWQASIDWWIGTNSDWEGEMKFNLQGISKYADIGSAYICGYGLVLGTPNPLTNYIQKIDQSGFVCGSPPFPFARVTNNNVGQITGTAGNLGIIGQMDIDTTAGWKCIDIKTMDPSAVQSVVAQARKGTDKFLYLRWWGADANNGYGTSQYQGPGTLNPAVNCPGWDAGYSPTNCGPYLKINYTDSPNLCTAQHTVRGAAWSQNIGWIRFSCSDSCSNATCSGPTDDYLNYGGEVNFDTGALSGYAWSENIGWIKLDPTGPYPEAPNYSACLNLSGTGQNCEDIEDNQVAGWVVACSVFQSGCSGNLNPNAAWDGWIKLRGPTYGVWRDTTLSPRQLRDWAWSDNVIGWVSFNCKNQQGTLCAIDYKVILDSVPPTVTLNSCAGASYPCYNDPCMNALHPRLSWNYVGTGTQGAYRIQISNKASFPDWAPATDLILDRTVNPSSSSSYTVNNVDLAAYGKVSDLSYGTTYSWRVKLKKQGGDWSDWPTPDTFTTFAHELPDPSFTHDPQNPPANQPVTFTDTSTCYDLSNNPYPCKNIAGNNRYQWDFETDTIIDCDSNSCDPACGAGSNCKEWVKHTYTAEGTRTVTLSITDPSLPANKNTCTFAEPVSSFRLPQWKEVSPTGWVNKFLAGVSAYLGHLISP